MPIKKEPSGKRWVEMELILPATAEQVWHALATGPGYAGWFIRASIDGRVGGALRFDFGAGVSSHGEVTAWDPPGFFAYVERDWEKGAPPVATEITITSRSGDRCVLRMVHSLFTSSDDWDDQVEGFEQGWPTFFHVLRVYLLHFAGWEADSFMLTFDAGGELGTTWQRLCSELNLAGANVAERRGAVVGGQAWSGVVERVEQESRQRYCLLRLDEPSPGIALFGVHTRGSTTTVSICHYFYGDGAEARAAASEPVWRDWLAKTFAPR